MMSSHKRIKFDVILNRCASLILKKAYESKSGHIGGSLSLSTLLVPLMYDPKFNQAKHKICISKGHASLALYSILHDLCINSKPYETYCSMQSDFHGHINKEAFPESIIASSGSLGHGLPIAIGYAYHMHKINKEVTTYCFIGDGEFQEGSILESLMLLKELSKDINLKIIIDCNGGTSSLKEGESLRIAAEQLTSTGNIIDTIALNNTEALDAYSNILYSPGLQVIACQVPKGMGINDIMKEPSRWHAGLPRDPQELNMLLSKISFKQFQ